MVARDVPSRGGGEQGGGCQSIARTSYWAEVALNSRSCIRRLATFLGSFSSRSANSFRSASSSFRIARTWHTHEASASASGRGEQRHGGIPRPSCHRTPLQMMLQSPPSRARAARAASRGNGRSGRAAQGSPPAPHATCCPRPLGAPAMYGKWGGGESARGGAEGGDTWHGWQRAAHGGILAASLVQRATCSVRFATRRVDLHRAW